MTHGGAEPALENSRDRAEDSSARPASTRPASIGAPQLDLGLRVPARPLVLSRKLTQVPLDRYRLPDDGRKWKSLAKQRQRLAMHLAAHGDPDGTRIYCSIESMERFLGCSRRATFYVLGELEKLGLLRAEPRLTSERGTRIRTMNLAALDRAGVQDSRPGVQDSRPGVQNSDGTQPFLTVQTEIQNLGAVPAPETPAASAASSASPVRAKTESQKRYGDTRRLIDRAIAMLDTDNGHPRSYSDLAEDLKCFAAVAGFEYDGEMVWNAIDIAQRRIRARQGAKAACRASPASAVTDARQPASLPEERARGMPDDIRAHVRALAVKLAMPP